MPYLTPEDIPGDDLCRPLSIPHDTTWLSLFSGALTELTKPYNWEQFGALTVDETVAKMQSIIDNYFSAECGTCTTPGGYRVIRITTEGHLEELTSGGDWQPTTGDYAIPSPEARTGGTSEDQICLAAKNAVNVLQLLYEDLSDSWNANLDEAEAITAAIAVFVAEVGFEAAPIVWGIMAFFLPIFALLYAGLEYLIADLWDADFTRAMVCWLRECGSNTDGVVTFDYECFMARLNSLTNTFGLTEEQIRLYIQVGYLLWMIGGMDALNLAGRTTAITDDNCDGCNCTGTSIDFTTGTQGFVESSWNSYPSCGQYLTDVFGTGWYFDSCSGENWITLAGDVAEVCGNGINVNGQYNIGGTAGVIHIRVTTATQEKNVTFTPSGSIFLDVVHWDEGGSLDPAEGLVQIAFRNPTGYGGVIHSFQTGDV